jgi:protein-disulfide isomerase
MLQASKGNTCCAMVLPAMCRTLIARTSQLILLAAVLLGAMPAISLSQDLEEVTAAGMKAILARPGIEITGAGDADVTIVEYFDYNCPFCKRLVPTFQRLLASDHKIAIVYKDGPILGEVSAYAAHCALAARWQGKYLVAHDALLAAPHLARDAQVESALGSTGIDVVRLKKDLTTHAPEITALLARNASEARSLQLDGTPGILVGRQLMPGGAELDYFQKLIAAARLAK